MTAVIGLAAAGRPATAQEVASGDFNNDGLADLAVGVPDEMRRSFQFDAGCFCGVFVDHPGAGAVNVIYGTANGLTPVGSQVLSRGTTAASTNAHFGRALAAGRFRGPGFASDLAVAIPGVSTGGAIAVVFSASGKLNGTPNQTIYGNQYSGAGTAIGGTLAFHDDVSMVRGDFNGDQFADLAVEVINGSQSHTASDSGVLIFYGTSSGLDRANTTLLVVTDVMAPHPTYRPECGRLNDCVVLRGHVGLAAADLNGDGRDDLVLGSPAIRRIDDDGESIDGGPRPGIIIVRGASAGLNVYSAQVELADGIHGPDFGDALAIGDFTGDGRKDIAVGDPSTTNTGSRSVVVFRAALAGGTVFTPAFEVRQSDSANQTDEAEDRFGAALAALDINADGAVDLAVGAPGESVGTSSGIGAVTLFFGTPGGSLETGTSTTFTQPQLAAPFGVLCCFTGAGFGSSLAGGNFGLGAPGDLMIGSPSFTMFPGAAGVGIGGAGSVLALHGVQGQGVFAAPPFLQHWTQNRGEQVCTSGICFTTAGTAASGNHFGAALR